MELRKLGNSDLNITPIGFGAWAIGGGKWEFSWGPQDDQHSIDAIHAALDSGINWIDTAAVYGLGHSEEVVSRAVKGLANKPYIFTKCGLLWDDEGYVINNLKAGSIRRELEASLSRLQVDVIDLYQIHWPNPDLDIEEAWTELAKLKGEGKVRWIGVSNFDVLQLRRAEAIAPITNLQPPYSLLDRGVEHDVLPYCRANGIGVINYSPMASGLLTGAMTRDRVAAMSDDDWRKTSDEFHDPKLGKTLDLVGTLGEIAARHGVSTGAVAIAWTLANPAITGAIVGARNPKQIEGIKAALEFRLSADEVAEIESFQKAQA